MDPCCFLNLWKGMWVSHLYLYLSCYHESVLQYLGLFVVLDLVLTCHISHSISDQQMLWVLRLMSVSFSLVLKVISCSSISLSHLSMGGSMTKVIYCPVLESRRALTMHVFQIVFQKNSNATVKDYSFHINTYGPLMWLLTKISVSSVWSPKIFISLLPHKPHISKKWGSFSSKTHADLGLNDGRTNGH